jgi:hypothetical protein
MEDELMAEKLHELYLEATKELNPKSYNPNAQKAYKDLTEEQKFIDRYIAKAILSLIRKREIEARIDEQKSHTRTSFKSEQDARDLRIKDLEQQLKDVER